MFALTVNAFTKGETGSKNTRERRLVSAKEQRKRHEVENGTYHITSMDHTAQGGLAGI